MSNATAPAMGQLQAQVRQLETQLAESNVQHNAAETVPRTELDQEKAAHDSTKVELAKVNAKLALAKAKIARGIVHNKHRDWDAPVLTRQSWIEWYEGGHYDVEKITLAYRKCCIENNISSNTKSPYALRYVDRDSVRRERRPPVNPEQNFELDQHFPFMRLVKELPDVARKIALMTMKKGSIVHFIARLDITESYPPARGGLCTVAKVPMRFWWGPGKDVHINSAPTIDYALAPLHVCRDFMEIFGHAFWGHNKFSFASFGELNIFKRHIRRSWIERIQNVELWWQGSANVLPLDWGVNPANDVHYDRRTWPLMTLTWMSRLKSIEIYVDESSNLAKRRRNEPEFVQKVLREANRGVTHENKRGFRDLRKLHGLDYVYQLRGMRKVFVYDMMADEKRTEVMDKSFVRDMRAQVTKRKSKKRAKETRIDKLKSMLRWGPVPYEKSPQVGWIVRSLLGDGEKWDSKLIAGGENGPGGGGGGGDGGLDDDDGHDEDGGAGYGNGGGGGNAGNGGGGPQDRDSDSDSDNPDDSDQDRNSMFVIQPNLSSVVGQGGRFQGRRNMGRDANGAPTHGFGNRQNRALGGTAIELDIDDDDSNGDDGDVVVDEDRSTPARPRNMPIDLTSIPDDGSEQVKHEDKDMDVEADPSPNPGQNIDPALGADGMKPDNPPAAEAPAPQPGHASEDNTTGGGPKADEGIQMRGIYGGTPELANSGAYFSPHTSAQRDASAAAAQEMPEDAQERAHDVQNPDAVMAGPQGSIADASTVSQVSAPAEDPIPSVEHPDAIMIDDDEDDDDVQFIEERFEPIKIEDDDDDLPDVQEAIARSLSSFEPLKVEGDDDGDVPYMQGATARGLGRSKSIRAASSGGGGSNVKVEDSTPSNSSAIQCAASVMREAAILRRSYTPAAGRYTTPETFASPSSSRDAAQEEAFNDLDFGTPSPDPETPRARSSRRDSSSSSSVDASVQSSATSRKRSRDDDASTPRPVDIDQLASPSRRSSRSSNGLSTSVMRGIDQLDLMEGQQDGGRDSPSPKRGRGIPTSSPRERPIWRGLMRPC